jgi:hypothetical protein
MEDLSQIIRQRSVKVEKGQTETVDQVWSPTGEQDAVPEKVVEFNETVKMNDPIRGLGQRSFQERSHCTYTEEEDKGYVKMS